MDGVIGSSPISEIHNPFNNRLSGFSFCDWLENLKADFISSSRQAQHLLISQLKQYPYCTPTCGDVNSFVDNFPSCIHQPLCSQWSDISSRGHISVPFLNSHHIEEAMYTQTLPVAQTLLSHGCKVTIRPCIVTRHPDTREAGATRTAATIPSPLIISDGISLLTFVHPSSYY